MDKIIIRKSTVKDAPSIAKIVNSHAEKGIMLPRPISKIYDNIRDYYVVESNGDIVGCDFHGYLLVSSFSHSIGFSLS